MSYHKAKHLASIRSMEALLSAKGAMEHETTELTIQAYRATLAVVNKMIEPYYMDDKEERDGKEG